MVHPAARKGRDQTTHPFRIAQPGSARHSRDAPLGGLQRIVRDGSPWSSRARNGAVVEAGSHPAFIAFVDQHLRLVIGQVSRWARHRYGTFQGCVGLGGLGSLADPDTPWRVLCSVVGWVGGLCRVWVWWFRSCSACLSGQHDEQRHRYRHRHGTVPGPHRAVHRNQVGDSENLKSRRLVPHRAHAGHGQHGKRSLRRGQRQTAHRQQHSRTAHAPRPGAARTTRCPAAVPPH